jgi:phosphatidylinositol alpha-1,6-mannosyltransferase
MRKTIVHLVHERIGAIGGIQRFDLRVMQALQELSRQSESEFDLQVLALRDIPPGAPLPDCLNIQSAGGSYVRLALLLARLHLRARVAQVLVGHAKLVRCCFLAKLLFWRTRYRLFVHGIEVWSLDQTKKPKRISRALLDATVDDVIAVSQYTVRRMSALFGIKRYSVLPNAIDYPEAGVGDPPGGWDRPDRAPCILSVSRLDSHDGPKGIDFALRAVALLRKQYPSVRYQIVGDGVLRSKLEELAGELGLRDCVHFRGRLSDAEVQQAFRESDVFLLPSRKEGFGIVFLEAWKFGLPVVCGNTDASPEVVENGMDGFAVDPFSAPDIAAALHKLLEDRHLRELFVRHGRSKLATRFSESVFRRRLRQLLELEAVAGLEGRSPI